MACLVASAESIGGMPLFPTAVCTTRRRGSSGVLADRSDVGQSNTVTREET
jgi:hypothetical protein